jgi:predicted Na+-dependent transporter
MLVPLSLPYGVNFDLSTFVAGRFFCRADGIALVYGMVMRNLSIALALAMTSFGQECSEIVLIIALAYSVQCSRLHGMCSFWNGSFAPRWRGSEDELCLSCSLPWRLTPLNAEPTRC